MDPDSGTSAQRGETGPGQTRAVIRPADVETFVFDWGVAKWLASPEICGSTTLSAGVSIIDPGGAHPVHVHEGVEKVTFVISGRGEQLVVLPDGTRVEEELEAGTMIYVPAGAPHETRNPGWEPLVVLVVYAQAGPEQALRELPDFRSVPAGRTPER